LLRVLGIIAIVIGLVTALLLAYLSYIGFSTLAVSAYSVGIVPPAVHVTERGTIVAVAVSDTVYLRGRVEGYRYTVSVFTYNPTRLTVERAETYLLSKKDFDAYVRGMLVAFRAAVVSLDELRSTLRKTALDYSPMHSRWRMEYIAEELDMRRENEVIAVVVVEYNPTGMTIDLPNGTIVVTNPTILRTINLSLLPPIEVPVRVHVFARLDPSLDQYLRCLDLVVAGALLVASDLLSRMKLRARTRR